MGGFSLWHWIVVIILILLLFGRGRISDMMGDIGKGLKSFKQGIADDDKPAEQPRQIPQQQQPIDITPNRPAESTQVPPASGDDQSRP